ncbi:hypothetical protein NQ315_012482 [Exocentrus adspersus]|uniref:Uncharacterized protein n=1 Tax=Exocentrus adspersus TaxID=1586481 RepID=A0AAV8VN35_9CUCU|nr:hypothetical protein NQ315_012482 [Exocentrus adspersus]
MTKTRTTPLHSQPDGMVENFLRTAVNEKQTNWDTSSVLFGAELRLPIDLISERPKGEEDVDNYLSHLQDRLRLTHAEVIKPEVETRK